MSTKAWVNQALGMCDDLIGGSSLMWRYHHQALTHFAVHPTAS
jgi:fatty acid desaturase (delta-4 desaturase)